MIFVFQFKKRIASTYIFGIIVYKSSHLQDFNLVVLFKINKNSKISFYSTILFNSLIISLKMKKK